MVKGYHKCSFPIGVDDKKKKRGERDPALKVTDNSGGHQLGLYSINSTDACALAIDRQSGRVSFLCPLPLFLVGIQLILEVLLKHFQH